MLRKPQTFGKLLNISRQEAKTLVEVARANVVAPGAPQLRVISLARLLQCGTNTGHSKRHPRAGNHEHVRHEPPVPRAEHSCNRRQRSSSEYAGACNQPQIVVLADTARPAPPARHGFRSYMTCSARRRALRVSSTSVQHGARHASARFSPDAAPRQAQRTPPRRVPTAQRLRSHLPSEATISWRPCARRSAGPVSFAYACCALPAALHRRRVTHPARPLAVLPGLPRAVHSGGAAADFFGAARRRWTARPADWVPAFRIT